LSKGQFTQALLGQRRMLYAFIQSIVRDHSLSEDIFQEAVTIALEKQDVFVPGTNMGAWLRAIARRRIMKARDRATRRLTLLDVEAIDAVEAAHGRVMIEEWDGRLAALEECREKLPGKARRLLQLRYGQGLDFRTIAAQIRSTANSVQVTISKVRRRLRRCVETALAAEA
jgi:RNA polymerase sigma-70 factor (ECF subfamily)